MFTPFGAICAHSVGKWEQAVHRLKMELLTNLIWPLTLTWKFVLSKAGVDAHQCSPRAGLARRVTGGPWAGPEPGTTFCKSADSGRAWAGKIWNNFYFRSIWGFLWKTTNYFQHISTIVKKTSPNIKSKLFLLFFSIWCLVTPKQVHLPTLVL